MNRDGDWTHASGFTVVHTTYGARPMVPPEISQHDVMAFLATPAAHGPECGRVDRIDTHISAVFLAKDCAFS
ncbi:MAG TPA: hypothetical protein VIK60_07690 [Vicinamibacterales bacterium]